MAVATKEYLCSIGIGDLDECIAQGEALVRHVRAQPDVERWLNIRWRVYGSAEGIYKQFLDIGMIERLHKLTDARYPVLVVNLTYEPSNVSGAFFSAIEEQFTLHVLVDGSWPKMPWFEG